MNKQGWRPWAVRFLGSTLVIGVAAGCGQDAVTNGFEGFNAEVPEMSIDLSSEDGGLTAESEKPFFDDPYFSSYLDEDQEVEVRDDPLARDPRLADMEHRGNVRFVRVLWGNMTRGPEADGTSTDRAITNWKGQAHVTDGFLLPLRTIRFERTDYIVPPWGQDDPSRQKVEWVSLTGPGRDGILFKIVVPPAEDVTLTDVRGDTPGDGLTPDDMFVFETVPLQARFAIDTIAELDTTIMVDDMNGVSFTGFDLDDLDMNRCPRGGLAGAWVRVDNDEHLGGFFRARWLLGTGRSVGHVRGRWGVTADGEKLFVGKLIALDGRYMGHVRGRWGRSDESPGRGFFAGIWEARAADGTRPLFKGRLEGMWVVSDRVEDGGLMRGVWKAACHEDCDPEADA